MTIYIYFETYECIVVEIYVWIFSVEMIPNIKQSHFNYRSIFHTHFYYIYLQLLYNIRVTIHRYICLVINKFITSLKNEVAASLQPNSICIHHYIYIYIYKFLSRSVSTYFIKQWHLLIAFQAYIYIHCYTRIIF